MSGGDRIRLFCALRLPPPALDLLERWQAANLPAAAGRPVPRENLHVTLAFLGSRGVDEVPAVAAELAAAAAAAAAGVDRLRLEPSRYRETAGVGMVVLADLNGAATALADGLRARLERLGLLRPDRRRWLPHVTVLRFRERPRLRPPLPSLGEVSPSDAAVYSSVLRPAGARYEVLESVALSREGHRASGSCG